MSLVFAAVIPHSTATITANDLSDVASSLVRTRDTIKEVEGELYVMQPDTLFVLSPHAPIADGAFSLNLAQEFICTYQDFGDDSTSLRLGCDIELISKLREYADRDAGKNIAVNIINQPELDYGSAVALYHLSQHLPAVKVVPISLSNLSIEQHYRFGQALRYVAMQSNKRVAFITTAELGHTVVPAGATFAQAVLQAIKSHDLSELQNFNLELAESAQSVNEFKCFVVLSGVLSDLEVQAKINSNETYNGRGLLVSQFNLI